MPTTSPQSLTCQEKGNRPGSTWRSTSMSRSGSLSLNGGCQDGAMQRLKIFRPTALRMNSWE
jgi:hypothetical protein